MARWAWTQATGLALVMVAAGCAHSSPDTTQPPVTSAAPAPAADVAPAGTASADYEDQSTAELVEHDRHHHHGGLAMFVAMSLDSLGTTPEQEAQIRKEIQSDLRATMRPAQDAEKAVTMALADGVASGTVDQSRVDAAIAQLSAAAADVHDAVADSLNALHAVLTPEQRVALVDKLEAHLTVWREANAEDEPAPSSAHRGRLDALERDLALTPDQVGRIRASLRSSTTAQGTPDWKNGDARMQAFGDAFGSDHFDARTLPGDRSNVGWTAAWGATRMSHFYEAAVPVLSPDQRAKLADMLRRHANAQATQTISTR